MGAASTTSRRPDVRFLLASPAHFIALGFGSGLAPKAPGTFGTLAALVLFWLLAYVLAMPPFAIAFAAIPLFVLGLWASEFQSPEDYRRAEDESVLHMREPPVASGQRPAPSQSGCPIKGNRSRRGDWIYHLPGMPYYEQTVAEEVFCTEAQAVAAGYRRSRAR